MYRILKHDEAVCLRYGERSLKAVQINLQSRYPQ
jgi:hypothetical protein